MIKGFTPMFGGFNIELQFRFSFLLTGKIFESGRPQGFVEFSILIKTVWIGQAVAFFKFSVFIKMIRIGQAVFLVAHPSGLPAAAIPAG